MITRSRDPLQKPEIAELAEHVMVDVAENVSLILTVLIQKRVELMATDETEGSEGRCVQSVTLLRHEISFFDREVYPDDNVGQEDSEAEKADKVGAAE